MDRPIFLDLNILIVNVYKKLYELFSENRGLLSAHRYIEHKMPAPRPSYYKSFSHIYPRSLVWERMRLSHTRLRARTSVRRWNKSRPHETKTDHFLFGLIRSLEVFFFFRFFLLNMKISTLFLGLIKFV